MARKPGVGSIKAAVRTRDKACVVCGISNEKHLKRYGRSLDVHRVVAGSEYDIEHCRAVCRKCHERIPRPKNDGERQEAIRAAGLKPARRMVRLTVATADHDLIKRAARQQGLPPGQYVAQSVTEIARKEVALKARS